MVMRIEDVAMPGGTTASAFVKDYACVGCGATFRAVVSSPLPINVSKDVQRREAERLLDFAASSPYRHTAGVCPSCGSTAGVKASAA